MAIQKTKNKFSGPSKFVLLVGDEGAVLTQIQGSGVVRRLFAISPEPQHVRAVDEALQDSPQSPITVLFDVMDQSYMRQSLPPVSSLSVGKIISRRLAKDFAPDDIKGYIIVDREKTGRRDWNFMMVALANQPVLQKWISFVTERPNPLKGMGLLPLESQDFMLQLAMHFNPNKDKNAKLHEWQVLVSHHKVGGFRQIVLRDGRLVFTRMAQPIGDSTADVIAGNIEQEMINTLEYLKRLGLQEPSAISLTIVCSEEIKKVLDPKNIKAGEHHFLTPFEAGEILGIKGAAQPNDHFGDVVISAFIARRKRLVLTLNSAYTKKLQNLSLAILGAKGVAAVCGLALLFWIGSSVVDIFTAKSSISNLEAKHRTLVSDLATIKTKAVTLPKNINIYSDIMTLSQLFDRKTIDSLVIFDKAYNALKGDALVNTIDFSVSEPTAVTKAGDKRQVKLEIGFQLIAPHETRTQLRDSLNALLGKTKKVLPEYTISYPDTTGLVSDNADIKTIIGDSGSVQEDFHAQSENIKMLISGPTLDKNSKQQ